MTVPMNNANSPAAAAEAAIEASTSMNKNGNEVNKEEADAIEDEEAAKNKKAGEEEAGEEKKKEEKPEEEKKEEENPEEGKPKLNAKGGRILHSRRKKQSIIA
jgi:hypothetical protein